MCVVYFRRATENPSESGGSFDASGAFHGGGYSDEEEVSSLKFAVSVCMIYLKRLCSFSLHVLSLIFILVSIVNNVAAI